MKHHHERLGLVAPVLEKIESNIRNDVSHITGILFSLSHLDQVRVVIVSLPGKNIPVVEPGRVTFEMPLSDHDRLVAYLLEELGKCLLRSVELKRVVPHTVEMTVFSGQDDSPAGGADAVSAEAVLESYPFCGDAVDVGCLVDPASVTAHGMRGVIVRHDEQNVGIFRPGFLSAQTAGNRQRGHSQTDSLHELASFHRVSPMNNPGINFLLSKKKIMTYEFFYSTPLFILQRIDRIRACSLNRLIADCEQADD